MAKRVVTNPKLAVASLRVSTEDQHLGPEAQREAIQRWADSGGVRIVSWHTDHVSGGSPLDKRPGLLAALDSLRDAGAGVLVVAKRDRLARDVVIAAMIEQLVARGGACVASADGTGNGSGPADELMRSMVNAFAQYERALIRARTKSALAVKRSRGELTGCAPYGMRVGADGKTLEADASEQAVLEQVRDWRASGLSTRAIVAECERVGILGRTGKPFAQTQVMRMLTKAAA
jgi:DNA invertase Pin-like site-specific DNA recombinase